MGAKQPDCARDGCIGESRWGQQVAWSKDTLAALYNETSTKKTDTRQEGIYAYAKGEDEYGRTTSSATKTKTVTATSSYAVLDATKMRGLTAGTIIRVLEQADMRPSLHVAVV